MKRNAWMILLAIMMALLVSLAGCDGSDDDDGDADPKTVGEDHSARLPAWETSADELVATYNSVTQSANERLDALAAADMSALTFENTVAEYEEIMDEVITASNRAYHLKDVHPDEDIRNQAGDMADSYDTWFLEVGARGDIYKVIKAFADSNPELDAEDQKLMDDLVAGFAHAGFNAQGEIPAEITAMRQEILNLESQIEDNMTADEATEFDFTEAEMAGLSAEQLSGIKKEGDVYKVPAGSRAILRGTLQSFSPLEATREKAMRIYNSTGNSTDNIDLIEELVAKRIELAGMLGYETWNDYKTKLKMAKNGTTATEFITSVSNGLKDKFNNEVAELQKFIVTEGPDKNDDNGVVDSWDVLFLKPFYEKNFNVDYEAIRQYFPYRETVDNMFELFGEVFDLEFEAIENPDVWHQDVELYAVRDDESDVVLGYLYLDMFPRLDQGKYSHFMCNSVVSRKELPDGDFRRPVNVLICNFPQDVDGTPQPLSWGNLEYLVHEFGHALHCILDETRYASQYGFNVPDDFVEVPSQILEDWLMDEGAFAQLATGMPANEISATITAINKANKATIGLYYERQFAFGRMDLELYGLKSVAELPPDLVDFTNGIIGETYLPFPEGSSFLTGFGHILIWGYDSGYYSYAWGDAIVAELSARFEDSPEGFMDEDLGRKLRDEVFATGNGRDVTVSVEAFLGGPLDPDRNAFLRRLGI